MAPVELAKMAPVELAKMAPVEVVRSCDELGAFLNWQLVPVNAAVHWHLYLAIRSMQLPPLRQGLELHSLMIVSQNFPVYPVRQTH